MLVVTVHFLIHRATYRLAPSPMSDGYLDRRNFVEGHVHASKPSNRSHFVFTRTGKFILMLLFFGVADVVTDAVVARVVDDLLFTTPLSIPWESGFCYVVLLLIVFVVVAYSSDGPSPSDE